MTRQDRTRYPVVQEGTCTGGQAMKITAVRCVQYTGTMEFPGVFWEERLIRPVDIYPQYKAETENWVQPAGQDTYRMTSTFVHIETDAGITGTGGPIAADQAF